MSKLISWLKDIYVKAKANDFEWKNIYPNNMPCNGVVGIYTDMFFKKDEKYMYLKYSIQYASRVDKEGLSHPEEGAKYYVLHQLVMSDLDEKFEIPKPSDDFRWDENELGCLVNNYGRFRYVFDDEETAKCVVAKELFNTIYPYTYVLDDNELDEWNQFIDSMKKVE